MTNVSLRHVLRILGLTTCEYHRHGTVAHTELRLIESDLALAANE
jgi:hypothetical protein